MALAAVPARPHRLARGSAAGAVERCPLRGACGGVAPARHHPGAQRHAGGGGAGGDAALRRVDPGLLLAPAAGPCGRLRRRAMTRYRITHRTTYAYEAAVDLSHHVVMQTPRQTPRQRVLAHNV